MTITGSGAAGALRVTLAGQTQAGAKRPLIVRDISVISGGIPLHGKLVYPASGRTNVAAVRALRHMAPTIAKVGVGGSQGGWVAPLVVRLVSLDFVILAFAMAEGPIAQDRELVELQLRAAGFSEPALRLARALTKITARVMRSTPTDGSADRPLAALDAFKARHARAPWLAASLASSGCWLGATGRHPIWARSVS